MPYMMVRPKVMGRSKIEIKEIQNKGAMYCTFTKRRNGLCSKARELYNLCGAQVAAIVFSPKNKMYTFGEPSVDSVVNRFLHEQQQQRQSLNRGGQKKKKKKTIQFLSDECIVLNNQFSQKLKLLGYGKFNHLTNTSNTPPHVWAETTF
ncbi:agamous-like MADS-box protein AGL62 [Quercus suber]|uniref:agamous-like MADS-box protein AGL62 n=1 Tax=Quercus suber TaxID=58331 RepID=UPI0032DE9491